MFKNYPFIKQTDIKDCGPVAIAMLIKYYKGYVPIERLRYLCKTSKLGTSAYNLINTLQTLGFHAIGIKTSVTEMNNKITLPAIAHVVINKTYNHYVVINEINYHRQYLIISDPADKIKKISFNEFSSIFTGVLVVAYPVRKLDLYVKTNLFKFIFNIIKNYYKEFISIFGLSVIILTFTILSSFYIQTFIDNLNTSTNKMIFIFIIFMFFIIIKEITNYFRNKLLITLNQKIDLKLTLDAFKNILFLPYQYYRNKTTGDIISRINDLTSVRIMISKVALNLFLDLPLSFITLIVLYILNNKLVIIVLIIMLIYILISFIYKELLVDKIASTSKYKSEVTSFMVETLSGFETIKGLGIESKSLSKLEQKYVSLLNETYKLDNTYNNLLFLKDFVASLGSIILFFVGTILIYKDSMTLGMLLSYNIISEYFLNPIRHIIDMDLDIKEAKNALKRVLEIMELSKEKGIITKSLKGNIIIKDLTHSFNQLDNTFTNLSLEIKVGEKIMLLGDSGSGKSTILKMIMKYYDVKRNHLFIDNYDICDIKKSAINQSISYISQDEILFTGTLLNNLKIASKSDQIAIQNAETCYVNEIIKDNNLGYNLLIEENGFNLSGGEKQRIILARTLSKPFNILLIDEGLNQIDIALERKILTNIFSKYKDKTIIIVSHRLDNMDLYNKVLRLKNNKFEVLND